MADQWDIFPDAPATTAVADPFAAFPDADGFDSFPDASSVAVEPTPNPLPGDEIRATTFGDTLNSWRSRAADELGRIASLGQTKEPTPLLPKWDVQEGAAGPIEQGITQSAYDQARGFVTPEALPQLAAGVATIPAFIGQRILSTPEQYGRIRDALRNGDSKDVATAITNELVPDVMAFLGVKHGAKKVFGRSDTAKAAQIEAELRGGTPVTSEARPSRGQQIPTAEAPAQAEPQSASTQGLVPSAYGAEYEAMKAHLEELNRHQFLPERPSPESAPSAEIGKPDVFDEVQSAQGFSQETRPQPAARQPQDLPQQFQETSQQSNIRGVPMEEQQPSSSSLSSVAQPESQPTSTKNAATEQELSSQGSGISNAQATAGREARDLNPAERVIESRSWETLMKEAKAELARDPDAGRNLVDDLTNNPHALATDTDVALLAHRTVEAEQAFDSAIAEQNSKPGDESVSERVVRAREELNKTYAADDSSGTPIAQALAARRLIVRNDYSLGRMERETRAIANKGRPFDPKNPKDAKLLKWIQEMHAKIAKTTADEVAYERSPRSIKRVAFQQAKAGRTFNDFLEEQAGKIRERRKPAQPETVKFARQESPNESKNIDEATGAEYSLNRAGRDTHQPAATSVDPTTGHAYSLPDDVRKGFVRSTKIDDTMALSQFARAIEQDKVRRAHRGRAQARLEPVAYDSHSPVDISVQQAELLGRAHGHRVVWLRDHSGESIDGAYYNGRVFVNVDSLRDPVHAVAGHELVHAMRRNAPELYDQLAKVIARQSKGRTEAYDANRIGRKYLPEELREEHVADFVGETITDPRQLQEMLRDNPTLYQRAVTFIQDFIDKIKRKLAGVEKGDYPTARETIRNLEKAQRAMREAFREYRQTLPESGIAEQRPSFARQSPKPAESDDLIIGASHIAKGASNYPAWAEAVRQDQVTPTPELYRQAKQFHDETAAVFRSPEQKRLDRLKTGTIKRAEEYRSRLEAGDFEPRQRNVTQPDAELSNLRYDVEKAKEDYHRGLVEARLKQRTGTQKLFGGVGEVFNTTRALMTSFDLSAVLRQGGFVAFGHPIRAAKAFGPMFRALASERGQFRVMDEIRNRPNAPLYKQAKLYIAETGVGSSLSKMEEAYASRWAKKIPGLGASERAYTTFLNKLRADSFDAMAATLARRGQPSLEESRAIANFVNVATGRGDMGQHATAAETLNKVFFAPRYVLSRFQLLAGQPLYRGTTRTRVAIAGEYAKMLAGAAAVYSLAAAGDDKVELDPRSSDFLKIRFGNARLDPFFGMLQTTTLLSRLGSGYTKNSKGEMVAIRGNTKFGATTSTDVMKSFLRSKLAPIPGAAVTWTEGSNAIGQPMTLFPKEATFKGVEQSIAGNAILPISFGDISNAMQGQGIARGTALATLSLLGMGLQNYDKTAKRPKPLKSVSSKPFDLDTAITEKIREQKMLDIGATLRQR